MNGIYFLLTAVALIGLLPLVIILVKKRRVDRILANGLTARATVYHIQALYQNRGEIVRYQFEDLTRQVYQGLLTTKAGAYKTGDLIEIFYLQDNPKRNTVRGSWNSKFIIGFGIAIALFVWFAVYKIFEMVRDSQA